jgi:transposase InsO family protein
LPYAVGRVCAQAGVAKLPPLQEAAPPRRYERDKPGELLHLDTQKLARFDRPGQRVTGDVTQDRKKPGYHALQVAIDDPSRVGFSRIMTDNGSAYRARKFAKLLRRLKIRQVRTRPYTPRTPGKAERFIQTLLREWA